MLCLLLDVLTLLRRQLLFQILEVNVFSGVYVVLVAREENGERKDRKILLGEQMKVILSLMTYRSVRSGDYIYNITEQL